ncbi:MAG: hypothetical protein M3O67_01330, partial [Bacteroidota bacterium]|nr:hypothetical protein [Bacteroidota bacterium]
FEDSLRKRKTETHYCFLLENEKEMAQRSKSFLVNKKMIRMENTDKDEFTKLAIFEYMIGNTDWEVQYLQNIKLISKDSSKAPITIPYDFDHAGIVSAPYALPAEELGISSVRDRLYRGYCLPDKKKFAQAIELFNRLKNNFYNVYTSCSLLNEKYIKATTRFLDDFYNTINNEKKVEEEFGKPCRSKQRIVIKGLNE